MAATSSCVDSGLLAHSATSAPPATSAFTRFAVSVVTCKHAPKRKPLNGLSLANRSPIAASTGMLWADQAMRRRPSGARLGSLMSYAGADALVCVVDKAGFLRGDSCRRGDVSSGTFLKIGR